MLPPPTASPHRMASPARFSRVPRICGDGRQRFSSSWIRRSTRRIGGVAAAIGSTRAARGFWAITSLGKVLSRKHHAGASASLTREAAAPRVRVPAFLRTNVVVSNVRAGEQELYVLPDLVLIVDRGRVGAVSYLQLRVYIRPTSFIEDGPPPQDAPQIRTTWRFVNKNGTPDRRSRDNCQLPIMRYAELDFTSASGVKERSHSSNATAANRLVASIDHLRRVAAAGGGRSIARQP